MNLNIVITGVGGQGNVLASRILAQAAVEAGYKVRTSEAIGMAQREGMVMSHVRMGECLYGAVIPDGKADVLLGFELAETIRGLPKLNKKGVVIANKSCVIPVSAALGISSYQRDKLTRYLQDHVNNLHLFDATALAAQAGTVKATNIVLLGALAALNLLPYTCADLLNVVLESVPSKFKDVNKRAFELGYRAMEV
ncbi:indolepyruvate ferredoxin oxidoreductase beta subunit [Desulfohalotomaculum tongense]|uniref:indolepyruvate oxidoreductase subunit beta n=1 Tax=Desulforadius tongensis TaxID=1216062 RepID=UPI00195BA797|nr:indolepyruvate oxidoreductase subunit beta [Desulforadius tongensis]MBM7854102.1 indolepyruvate ferredoxin oxidoreductase beta subunit [Desulforadius tongensis]